MNKCVIVPFDFSNEADYALDHAHELTKAQNIPIHLIHIVDKEADIEEWQLELQKVADLFSAKHSNCNVVAVVRAGNLFRRIYEYGIEANAYLAIMGTHGLKTINRAMKVIKKFVKIPFILVQRPVNYGEYDKICVPIDWDRKSRAKFLWVKYLSNLFESKVFVVYPQVTSDEKREAINSNIKFAASVFESENIDFDAKALPYDNYADHLYDYMSEIKPDIVLLMTDRYKDHISKLKRARNLQYYKRVPIMCVNPRTDIVKIGSFN